MGNMSNPTVNRWGLNLFWYRFWYYDKNYYLSCQHDNAIIKLVYTFLNFGILYPVNMFIHRYWFDNLKLINYRNEHNTKYYRLMSFKNLISNEINYYKERVKIENIYQSKIWILKFQHWIVINFYCFNPIKKRQIIYNKKRKNLSFDIYLTKFPHKFENHKRLKMIFFFFLKKLAYKDVYYKF